MDNALAISVLIILLFVGFVLWARSAQGAVTLRHALGEPGRRVRLRRAARRRSSSGSKPAAGRKSVRR